MDFFRPLASQSNLAPRITSSWTAFYHCFLSSTLGFNDKTNSWFLLLLLLLLLPNHLCTHHLTASQKMLKSLKFLSSLSFLLTLAPFVACPLGSRELCKLNFGSSPQPQPPSRSPYFNDQNHHPTRCKSQKFCGHSCHFPLFSIYIQYTTMMGQCSLLKTTQKEQMYPLLSTSAPSP